MVWSGSVLGKESKNVGENECTEVNECAAEKVQESALKILPKRWKRKQLKRKRPQQKAAAYIQRRQ